MIFILISILVIFICFFLLFLFSKQDFVLLRQNISLSEVFDAAIVIFLFAILTGRIFYILDSFNFELLHALRFFYITRFPGVSVLGFFLGGALAVRLLFRNKKGLRRINDIFAISFLPMFAFFVLAQGHKNIIYSVVAVLIIILSFVFFTRSHQKYILKDGSNALAIIALVAIDVIISQFLFPQHKIVAGLSLSSIFSIILLPVVGVGIYITQKSSKT